MTTIADFRNAIRSGLQRQHKWQVIFDFPTTAATGDVSRQATLLARTTAVPSSTLGNIDLQYEGRRIPVPGDRTYEEFVCTFIGVHDYKVRDAFEIWSESINGSESNDGLVNFDDFMRDITLNLLDSGDNVVKTYVLKDAWPQIVGVSDLDKASQDSFTEFPVTFQYVNYESNTTR